MEPAGPGAAPRPMPGEAGRPPAGAARVRSAPDGRTGDAIRPEGSARPDGLVRPEGPGGPPGRPEAAGRPDAPVRPDGPGRPDGAVRAAAVPPRVEAPVGVLPDGSGGSAASSPGAEPARGARAEIRRQLREQRRLKTIALLLASLLVLGALPTYFGLRAATRDPVFNSLDALAVPSWAAVDTVDGVSGSRWCFIECRFRERTVESERKWEETAQAYETALSREGWQPWKVAYCPEQPVEGHYTCWRRDELTLDMWVRSPACTADPAGQLPIPGATPEVPRDENCDGSLVSIKVRNAIADERLGPQPSTDPSLTGEDPDPLSTYDPLSGLTPLPTPS